MRTDDTTSREEATIRELNRLRNLPDDAIITRSDLQALWDIGINTIRRAEQRGELPLVRLSPRRVGYRMGTIRRLTAEREAVA